MNEINILGIIPARGGSKGVPDKNIKILAGKPLIAYAIESAKKSKWLTECIVSTDSPRIASISKECDARVPFLRPAELAQDESLAIDVVRHALFECEKIDQRSYDIVVLLQPTTPLKSVNDIDKTIQKLVKTGCDSVVTVVDVDANHPARMYTLEDDKMVSVLDEGVAMRPRQELASVYIRSGAVYACKREIITEQNSLIGSDCRPYIMPEKRSVNIDSPKDFYLAEYYLTHENS